MDNRTIEKHGFSFEDIEHFYTLYRDGRLRFQRAGPQHRTRFTAIEDFIVETRRTEGVVAEYGALNIIGGQHDLGDDAELMRFWLTKIVPSCVYKYRSGDFGQTGFYICCFRNCARPLSSQFALIRHYKEQHFHQMPPGIFGEIVIFKCDLCGFEFKRAAHLNAHFGSLAHIEKMAQNGIYVLFIAFFPQQFFNVFFVYV